MPEPVDFFFASDSTPLQRRRAAALRSGLFHGSRIEPCDPVPGEPVRLLCTTNAAIPIDAVAVYYTTGDVEPLGRRGTAESGYAVRAELSGESRDEPMGLTLHEWSATLPGQPDGTLVRYRIEGWCARDSSAQWRADEPDPIGAPLAARDRLFAYAVDMHTPPAWFRDAVVYQIVVDRFAAARDEPPMRYESVIVERFGGTLRGVAEKLGYLEELGVNCLWLSPVFASPSHHLYNPSSYYEVDPRLGTNHDLRELIAAAHQRGMRVILDFVANHTSDEHPAFLAAVADPSSSMHAWYSFGNWKPHGYRSYDRVADMPELVTEHPEVQRYLTAAALHWLRDFGADGLRLDYVPGPPHAFWTGLYRAVKREMPQALLLGEITDTPQAIATYAGRMDAVMDFELARLLRRVFATRETPLSALVDVLTLRAEAGDDGLMRATLLGNHDMHRFLWLAGGDVRRLELASLCLLTLPGTPIIYYGTEVGVSQDGDARIENAYARGPMRWGDAQDSRLLSHYRALIALRRSDRALREGAMSVPPQRFLESGGNASQTAMFLRTWETHAVLVAVNNSHSHAAVRVDLPATIPQPCIPSPLHWVGECPTIEERGAALTVALAPMSAAIFALRA